MAPVASATEARAGAATTVERNRRASRWTHGAVATLTLVLLFTGGWLLAGREGDPSPLARATGVGDAQLHRWVGWAAVGLVVLAAVVWWHRLRHFVRETFRWDRGDGAWLLAWPKAAVTGRFRRHDGDYDPGQRVANLVLVGGLLVLVASGAGLALVHGGPAFVWFHRVHVWATWVVGAMVAGHVLVAAGVLPGYRGAWRAMHLGGRLPVAVARRLWPAWLERRRGG